MGLKFVNKVYEFYSCCKTDMKLAITAAVFMAYSIVLFSV